MGFLPWVQDKVSGEKMMYTQNRIHGIYSSGQVHECTWGVLSVVLWGGNITDDFVKFSFILVHIFQVFYIKTLFL